MTLSLGPAVHHQHSFSDGAVDPRAMPRSNMYIAALLLWDGSSSNAKIRNMSAAGALVEAPAIPTVGSAIRLARGSLDAEGEVAWSCAGRCGIHFKAPITIADWIAPPRNSDQGRVDDAVAVLKAGAVPLADLSRHRTSASNVPIEAQLATDLREVSSMLQALGAALVRDPHVVGRHGTSLQDIDIATQTLDAAIDVLKPGCASQSDVAARLVNLRASRAQAIRRFG